MPESICSYIPIFTGIGRVTDSDGIQNKQQGAHRDQVEEWSIGAVE